MKTTTCPNCLTKLDMSSAIGDRNATPSEGDFSVCAYCATIARYDSELQLRALSTQDLVDMDPEDYKLLNIVVSTLHDSLAMRSKKDISLN